MKKNTFIVLLLISISLFCSSCAKDTVTGGSTTIAGVWNATSWFNNNIEEIGPGVTISIEFIDVLNEAGTMKLTINVPSDLFIYEGDFSIVNGQLSADLDETTNNSEVNRNVISAAITFNGNQLEIDGTNTAYSPFAPTSTYPLVVTAVK